MALARDRLREATEFLNENGRYFTTTRPGAWVRCPVCKGKEPEKPGPRCKTCKGRGALQKRGRPERHRYQEAMDQKDAAEAIAKLSAALGLDPTARVRIKGKASGKTSSGGLKEFLDHARTVRG